MFTALFGTMPQIGLGMVPYAHKENPTQLSKGDLTQKQLLYFKYWKKETNSYMHEINRQQRLWLSPRTETNKNGQLPISRQP